MIADLHNHTKLCNHATGETTDYVKAAIAQGTKYFGFSDHAPMYFDEAYRMQENQMPLYEKEVLDLKEQFKDQINILLGYEVDYLDGYILDSVLARKVDYFIGSVHFIGNWGFDNPEFIGEYKGKDIDKIWQDYFEANKALVKSGLFDILGHMDLLKVFNFLPKKDIKILALDLVKEIKRSNIVVEINLSGLRKPVKEQYPSRPIIELLQEENVPITLSSDAHNPKHIGYKSAQILEMLKDMGLDTCYAFKNRDRFSLKF